MRTFILLAVLLSSSIALADEEGYLGTKRKTIIDPSSGNVYNVEKKYSWVNRGETTEISAFNPYTGSSWEQTVDAKGNMNGVDANGNSWTYYEPLGAYQNFGAGKYCVGKGLGRFCN
jgi:hypothetical protein